VTLAVGAQHAAAWIERTVEEHALDAGVVVEVLQMSQVGY